MATIRKVEGTVSMRYSQTAYRTIAFGHMYDRTIQIGHQGIGGNYYIVETRAIGERSTSRNRLPWREKDTGLLAIPFQSDLVFVPASRRSPMLPFYGVYCYMQIRMHR